MEAEGTEYQLPSNGRTLRVPLREGRHPACISAIKPGCSLLCKAASQSDLAQMGASLSRAPPATCRSSGCTSRYLPTHYRCEMTSRCRTKKDGSALSLGPEGGDTERMPARSVSWKKPKPAPPGFLFYFLSDTFVSFSLNRLRSWRVWLKPRKQTR